MRLQKLRLGSRWTALWGCAIAGVVLAAGSARAAVLKQVVVADGGRVDLLFEGVVKSSQVQTEFFNDIIQVSLRDVAVYPAKLRSIAGAELTKIFAYQYAPKLTRARLTVRGNAEDFRDRLEIRAEGKSLSIRLKPTLAARDAAAAESVAREAGTALGESEERALLDRVLGAERVERETAPGQAAPSKQLQQKAEGAPKGASRGAKAAESVGREEGDAETKGRSGGWGDSERKARMPLPSPLRSLAMLSAVIGVFLLLALIVKKLRSRGALALPAGGGLAAPRGLGKFLSRLGAGGDRVIEVVANHYLGPKKSICVVKVGGKTLVLGVTNDSISLITQMGESGSAVGSLGGEGLERAFAGSDPVAAFDLEGLALESAGYGDGIREGFGGVPARAGVNSGGSGAVAAGPGNFSRLLGAEAGKPAVGPQSAGARSRIRHRLEGMKPL
jgi:flagellar biogenesis protein FliO